MLSLGFIRINDCFVLLQDGYAQDNLVPKPARSLPQLPGINVTEAQELPGRCGLHVNPLSCLTGSNNSPNSKNSVDNSASIFLLPSWSLIVATTLSFTSQFL
ncbi:hypothetical protein NC653_031611 [Populus alba x Populus x berolinensis]|uniref:Uncharacterized protein n=1 Tax=Populus alba x Populus x berolinensis TaxID=444605 RepID=A0AAD6Q3N1_9ROSI|nr:hypothetical protein NC653_031611 [Populus alba x Populus x berolinensis]